MSATQEIFQLLNQDLAVNKCLSNEIINSRALAKFLIKKYSLDYSEEAVVSAIRRYKPDQEKDGTIENALKGAMLFAKNNVVCVTTDVKEQEKLGKVLLDQSLKKNLRIARAKKYSKIIVYDAEVQDLLSHFLSDNVVSKQENLVEIRLLLKKKEVQNAVGLLSKVSAQVALYDIAIQEIIVALPEFLIYVKENDALKTQEALMKLVH